MKKQNKYIKAFSPSSESGIIKYKQDRKTFRRNAEKKGEQL